MLHIFIDDVYNIDRLSAPLTVNINVLVASI